MREHVYHNQTKSDLRSWIHMHKFNVAVQILSRALMFRILKKTTPVVILFTKQFDKQTAITLSGSPVNETLSNSSPILKVMSLTLSLTVVLIVQESPSLDISKVGILFLATSRRFSGTAENIQNISTLYNVLNIEWYDHVDQYFRALPQSRPKWSKFLQTICRQKGNVSCNLFHVKKLYDILFGFFRRF